MNLINESLKSLKKARIINENLKMVKVSEVDLEKFKSAAIKVLTGRGYSESDKSMKEISKAKTVTDVIRNGIDAVAYDLAQDKGYGSDGTIELTEELVNEVFESLGYELDWDDFETNESKVIKEGNMSYVRFENTYRDMMECMIHINDVTLSSTELQSRNDMIALCQNMIDEAIPADEMESEEDIEAEDESVREDKSGNTKAELNRLSSVGKKIASLGTSIDKFPAKINDKTTASLHKVVKELEVIIKSLA